MFEKIKQYLLLLQFPSSKNSIMFAAAAVFLTAVITFSLWNSNQGFIALFGSQENIPMAQVAEVLGGEAIPYRVNPDNGQILVKENALSRARMALASKGISAIIPTGYELMDKDQVLGSSQFIQNVRYKRSLEGELAKSIMVLDAVEHARVHLAIVESSSFVVNSQPDSSASVVIHLRYGKQMNDQQIGAIIQLVAGSVPGMKAENVRVVDQHGNLLSENYLARREGTPNAKNGHDIAEKLRNEATTNLSNLLVSIVGANNFRISVSPTLNLNKVEETQERYIGAPRVSDENVNQENTTNELALGIPGSLSNRPINKADTSSPQALSTRNQAQRKYAYDRNIRHVLFPGYTLEKMSVAIVLNQSAPQLAKWKAEQLTALNKLMIDAAGLDLSRGDSLTLNMMAFSNPPEIALPIVRWWQDSAAQEWAKLGLMALIALLIALFVARPLIQRFMAKEASSENTENTQVPVEVASQEASESISDLTRRNVFAEDDEFLPQSSGVEERIRCLQALTHSETERVAEVIKQWINCNERSDS
ncbi:flagellar basal-body MS-ring/collar protein FliF [Serratia sp. M24T3]|uniref:flagellar basal-body MS-ring/collar protein FliF n=1 Tax=Serratia sp. M24T3 TaxID=932213 RepID=UPI0002E37EDE|nr:flagellar basal-body MS-ring/collar protein FliF [Serratia sp. M24T3]